ncbi:hypothetical protein HDU76_008149 [Blyttiomyces sp. JEL0837]|nr:hypothetical protein HDU76_008149 [Blyttiomyces sp. JEL0837]
MNQSNNSVAAPSTAMDTNPPPPAIKRLWGYLVAIISKVKPANSNPDPAHEHLQQRFKMLLIQCHHLETKLAWRQLQSKNAPLRREEEIAVLRLRLADERQEAVESLTLELVARHQRTVEELETIYTEIISEAEDKLKHDRRMRKLVLLNKRKDQQIQALKAKLQVVEEEKVDAERSSERDAAQNPQILADLTAEGNELNATLDSIRGNFDELHDELETLQARLVTVDAELARRKLETNPDKIKSMKTSLHRLLEKVQARREDPRRQCGKLNVGIKKILKSNQKE